jgi:aerobic carbon-monoxide dehydrogenase medium subunit
MIPGRFDYHRPRSVDEAVALLARHGDEGRVIAGGHSLIPMMKLRLANPAHLIDLQAIDGLRGIEVSGGQIRLGALVTQHEMIASKALAEACPLLAEAALQIADPQVRYCGTIGGNVANGDPGNDLPAIMQCLDATYVLRGPGGERTVPARDFYQAPYVTALQEGEILTGVRLAAPPAGHGWAYQKMKRKIGDYATAAAAAVLSLAGGACRQASIALTNVGDTPLLAAAAAKALVGTRLEAAAVDAAVAAAQAITRPATDGRGSAEFRTHVAGVMTRRAIAAAHGRARQG